MRYYTAVYVQVCQPDSGLTLWIKEGIPKETPDKKRSRAVRSGRTRKVIKTKRYAEVNKMGLTLAYSAVLKSI